MNEHFMFLGLQLGDSRRPGTLGTVYRIALPEGVVKTPEVQGHVSEVQMTLDLKC